VTAWSRGKKPSGRLRDQGLRSAVTIGQGRRLRLEWIVPVVRAGPGNNGATAKFLPSGTAGLIVFPTLAGASLVLHFPPGSCPADPGRYCSSRGLPARGQRVAIQYNNSDSLSMPASVAQPLPGALGVSRQSPQRDSFKAAARNSRYDSRIPHRHHRWSY